MSRWQCCGLFRSDQRPGYLGLASLQECVLHLLILYLTVSPTISTPERRYETNEGVAVTLECVAEGNPKPTVQWYRSSARRTPLGFPDFTIEDDSLVIRNPNRDHTGTFTCRARNQVDAATIEAELEVFCESEIVVRCRTIYHYSGTRCLSCTNSCRCDN